MSGHSKWSKIKHKKGLNDAKKGKIFSKLAQQITVTARDGGGDLGTNFSLRLLVDKAKAVSMPADNVQRAIDRGTGKSGESVTYENVTYEGYGPQSVSVIVSCLTDNKNRIVADLRNYFSDRGGNLGESGAVSWNFSHLGLVVMMPGKMVPSEKHGADDVYVPADIEEVMLSLMEIEGVMDIKQSPADEYEDGLEGEIFEIYTDPKMLGAVRDSIKEIEYVIKSADLVWRANSEKELDSAGVEKLESFIEGLEEFDDVQEIWTDADHLL